MDKVTFATRVCKLMGIETMIGASELHLISFTYLTKHLVTNAAGGLNEDYAIGDIVCLNDVCISTASYSICTDASQHLNMAGLVGIHPLRGPNIDEFGVRFPPLSDAYDLDLRRRTHRAWKKLGLDQQKRRIHEGVYAFVAGPT